MSATTGWLTSFDRGDQSRPRVFCFPAAGGNTAPFYRWRRLLAERVQVVPVELPGHRNRLDEPLHRGVEPLVDELVPAILAEAQVPFALLGTSMGALIAFEVARRLSARQVPPAYLVVASCPSPRTPRRGTLHRLPDAEFLRELCRMEATPAEVLDTPELTGLLLPAWRADFALVETYTYRPGQRLDVPLVAVAAQDDPYAPMPEVRRWQDESDGPFHLVEADGGHFFFLDRASSLLPDLIGDGPATGVKVGDATS